MSALGKPVVRAAVYTRKSSDEGLDQEFNSLDAQHEACSAYIASQRHEGWKLRAVLLSLSPSPSTPLPPWDDLP